MVDVAVEEEVVQSPAGEIEDERAEALHREQPGPGVRGRVRGRR